MFSQKIRKGRSLVTIMIDKYQECRFHEVDNLDTKSLDEAENHYEETFIRIRDLLNDKPWCCDSREDVLSICQAISDELKQNLLIRKESK